MQIVRAVGGDAKEYVVPEASMMGGPPGSRVLELTIRAEEEGERE